MPHLGTGADVGILVHGGAGVDVEVVQAVAFHGREVSYRRLPDWPSACRFDDVGSGRRRALPESGGPDWGILPLRWPRWAAILNKQAVVCVAGASALADKCIWSP